MVLHIIITKIKKMKQGAFDPTKALLLVIYNFLGLTFLRALLVSMALRSVHIYKWGKPLHALLFLGFRALHASYANKPLLGLWT